MKRHSIGFVDSPLFQHGRYMRWLA